MVVSLVLMGLLVVSAGLLVITEEWRASLPALALLYGVLLALLATETLPLLVVVPLLSGIVTLLILVTTLRSLPPTTGEQYAFGMPYRLATAMLALALAYSLADTYTLPDVTRGVNFAVFWLGALGLLMLVLARRILAIGYALLMLNGVATLLLTIFNQGPGLTRLLLASLAQIGVAMGIAYLLVLERESETA
ncbi:MAG: hypothetical protein NZ518_01875 [Dehalococcoidia bacterium]|nr:hypothetical protein [Dehalococcoidia bacterium]